MYSYVLSSALGCTRAERQETFCSGRLGYAKTTSLNEMFPTTVCNVRPTRSLHASITTARSAVWIMVMAARRAFASAVNAGSTCPRPCAPILAHAPLSFSRTESSQHQHVPTSSMFHVTRHETCYIQQPRKSAGSNTQTDRSEEHTSELQSLREET